MGASSQNATTSTSDLRNQWLGRLTALLNDLQHWARELGWSTRLVEKHLEDSVIGPHRVPALLLQDEASRIFVEPIARSSPGAEGVVDLYLMPAYDDVASLYFQDGEWRLHYMFPDSPTVSTIREAEGKTLGKEEFKQVLEAMKKNAGQAI